MVKKINLASEPAGKEILSTPCVPVTPTTIQSFISLMEDLKDTANAHPGCVGLSANQIWESPDVAAPMICVVPGTAGWAYIINPSIKKSWKKETIMPEGCMSIPNFAIQKQKRIKHVVVSYYNEKMELQDDVHLFEFPARIFQHEVDHLRGKLLND